MYCTQREKVENNYFPEKFRFVLDELAIRGFVLNLFRYFPGGNSLCKYVSSKFEICTAQKYAISYSQLIQKWLRFVH